MKLTYKDRSTFLRVYNDFTIFPSETEVSAAFKRLLQANLPVICFITGDGERKTGKKGDREYKTITSDKTYRYALINQGFDVDTLSLNTQDIPGNIEALVIADPQSVFSSIVIQKIKAYINKGGNLLIAGEPGRQQILNPLLKTLGVQLTNGMLEQESEDYAPTLVLPGLTKYAIRFSKILSKPAVDTLPVSMNGVAGLSYHDTSGFHVQPLLVTKAGAVSNTMRRNPDLDIVNKKEEADAGTKTGVHMVTSSGGGYTMTAAVTTTPGGSLQKVGSKALLKGDVLAENKTISKDTFTTVLALTRQINGKEQRIIVSGDADFLSNSELTRRQPQVINFQFSTALFNWLDYGQFPVDTSRPDAKDNRVTVSTDHVAFLKIVYIYVIPGLILIFAAIFLIRRKRK